MSKYYRLKTYKKYKNIMLTLPISNKIMTIYIYYNTVFISYNISI